jgi:hydrogenase nickel incorporation protein HypB
MLGCGCDLAQNDRVARSNRERLDLQGVLAVNLVSCTGAGKTSLLEASIPTLQQEYSIGVIGGDRATDSDWRRLQALGVPLTQIKTGNTSHFTARMLRAALDEIDLAALDLLFIENAGGLACPAGFDLGQHHNVALLSVPEGDDKPQRDPSLFRSAELVLLTKMDLMDHVPEFSMQRVHRGLRKIGCDAPLLGVSNRRGAGIDAWCLWLHAKEALQSLQVSSRLAPRPTLRYS